jgi:glycosyltransferase involved in cell wall biosynthesis
VLGNRRDNLGKNMPKLAIVDHIVSAGGVERFVHGLIGGAIDVGITEDWEIVLVRSKYNSAGTHVPWPQYLSAPKLRLQYLGDDNPLSRMLNGLGNSGRVFGIPGTGFLKKKLIGALRSIGSDRWRAYCGETRCWLERFLDENNFDVAYFSFPYFLDPPQLKIPIIATPHDFTFKHGLTMSQDDQRLLDLQMAKWLRTCTQVVVSSQFIANDLKRFYPMWSYKTRVIRLGIPSAENEPTRAEIEEFRRHRGLPERFVIVVGWITEHKNQKVVFEAVAKLRDRGMRIPVVCVGPNSNVLNESYDLKFRKQWKKSYVAQILRFCESAGLKNGSDYFSLGFVDDFEVDCLYRSAMMLIVPTITEAGSFPAREAMRAGCPVAYSRIPVFEEEMQLIDGNAWTFPTYDSDALADVISEVAVNRDEAHRRAMAAKSIVSSVFCWKNTSRAYFSLFEELAEAGVATHGSE